MLTSVHGSALAAFAVLVLADLLTRWLALCSTHLKDTGRITEEINLYVCLVNIPAAVRAGYKYDMGTVLFVNLPESQSM